MLIEAYQAGFFSAFEKLGVLAQVDNPNSPAMSNIAAQSQVGQYNSGFKSHTTGSPTVKNYIPQKLEPARTKMKGMALFGNVTRGRL